MHIVYDHYETLSLGIAIGPAMFLLGLFFLKGRKRLSRALMVLGIIYFSISAILIYRFVQGEKELAKQREHAQAE